MNTMNAAASGTEIHTSDQAEKLSPISEVLRGLVDNVAYLGDTVARLEAQLEPVLGPHYPTPSEAGPGPEPDRTPRGAVTESVLGVAAEIGRLTQRLRELEGRLDV